MCLKLLRYASDAGLVLSTLWPVDTCVFWAIGELRHCACRPTGVQAEMDKLEAAAAAAAARCSSSKLSEH